MITALPSALDRIVSNEVKVGLYRSATELVSERLRQTKTASVLLSAALAFLPLMSEAHEDLEKSESPPPVVGENPGGPGAGSSDRPALAKAATQTGEKVPLSRELSQPATHPLDPLNAPELTAVKEILTKAGKVDGETLYSEVSLLEPAKASVLAWKVGDPLPRTAFVTLLSRTENKCYESTVDLATSSVKTWKEMPGVQPMVGMDEFAVGAEIVKADPQWQAAMKKRGLTDLEHVYIDVWAPGEIEIKGKEKHRILRGMTHYRQTQKNNYGPVVEGLIAVIDMTEKRLAQLVDTGAVPVPPESNDYMDEKVAGVPRPALKPLNIVAPEGSDFTVRGHEVTWQNWRFRYAMTAREGIVLYQVSYNDKGRERPVLYRASLSEMLVPYGDADPNWNWRSAFDQGEYGLGKTATKVLPGGLAPTNTITMNAVFADDRCEPYEAPATACLYERDGGVLWHHNDSDNGPITRRSRELCLGYYTVIGNYDYGLRWVFRLDGMIKFETELTGLMLTKAVKSKQCEACELSARGPGEYVSKGDDRFGTYVALNTVATNHQHFFNMRLDLDVDGLENGVKEINIESLPTGKDNPRGNAFQTRYTVFGKEEESARDLNPASARHWVIFNPNVQSQLGHSPSYVLEPLGTAMPMSQEDYPSRKLAGFLENNFVATQLKEDETHAAGNYPSQSKAEREPNLLDFAADNQSIYNKDLVVWYTFGVTHIPKPEEYPIMAVHATGFQLVPKGFFPRNPAMDVPSTAQEEPGAATPKATLEAGVPTKDGQK